MDRIYDILITEEIFRIFDVNYKGKIEIYFMGRLLASIRAGIYINGRGRTRKIHERGLLDSILSVSPGWFARALRNRDYFRSNILHSIRVMEIFTNRYKTKYPYLAKLVMPHINQWGRHSFANIAGREYLLLPQAPGGLTDLNNLSYEYIKKIEEIIKLPQPIAEEIIPQLYTPHYIEHITNNFIQYTINNYNTNYEPQEDITLQIVLKLYDNAEELIAVTYPNAARLFPPIINTDFTISVGKYAPSFAQLEEYLQGR